ncbi:ATP-dependent DNA helicase pif1-like [Prorops nasuta]|uniref:ATP-dependent DNA helicase pif1-like n=1 Tax=Prorops nasuta TaxID=863751 RepID=UPI0034CEA9F8
MISELNSDQKRVFDKVTKTVSTDNEILRLYVSGEGGTGKSFLIKTIRCWIKKIMKKDVIVSAPTGIAAFNIDGLTIHRVFQLPVEHGRTAKYRVIRYSTIKIIREELKNVTLIIIDEISMISNVTLMYIHLRLVEIFNTKDLGNGWFGGKHILFFGDLLQLPPVRDKQPFIKLSNIEIENYIGTLGSYDLWRNLFSYDELRINMQQKTDNTYKDILSRIRIGIVQYSDIQILLSKKINFKSIKIEDRMQELCDYISVLSSDTVCLLPTCSQCDTLNEAILSNVFKGKVLQVLNSEDEDSSRIAGLSRIIRIKLGARIMLRRNIDITLGLVNGTIATVKSVTRSVDNKDDIEKVQIILSTGVDYTIERVSVKCEVMDRVYVIRKQFPLCLSYGMTVHKSQGLSLQTAVVDVGNSIFTCGQAYVALSRVKTLEGLYIINYDPASVKASKLAIIVYSRLRKQFRPELKDISIFEGNIRKMLDTMWMIPKNIQECQIIESEIPKNLMWNVRGILNNNKIYSCANATMQCMLYCSSILEVPYLVWMIRML